MLGFLKLPVHCLSPRWTAIFILLIVNTRLACNEVNGVLSPVGFYNDASLYELKRAKPLQRKKLKGTVARDCRPLVFFNNRPHIGP